MFVLTHEDKIEQIRRHVRLKKAHRDIEMKIIIFLASAIVSFGIGIILL